MCSTTLLVVSVLLFLPYCNGENLELYVRPDNDQIACPPTSPPSNCRLLSDYAHDGNLMLATNTTFLFLPGTHILNTTFSINTHTGVDNLLFTANDTMSSMISQTSNGYFYVTGLDSFEIHSIDFSSPDVKSVNAATINITHTLNVIISNSTVRYNVVRWLYIFNSSLQFIGNTVENNFQWAMIVNSSAVFTDNTISNNTNEGRDEHSSPLEIFFSTFQTTGTNILIRNVGFSGGFAYAVHSRFVFTGAVSFKDNRAVAGGGLALVYTQCDLGGNIVFENNSALFGGGLGALDTEITLNGEVLFSGNSAQHGGAMALGSSVLSTLNGNITFLRNIAIDGGAIFLASSSVIHFISRFQGSVTFSENVAERHGGAIYVEDVEDLTYCIDRGGRYIAFQPCFLHITGNITDEGKRMIFIDNIANDAGDVLYGGTLDSCFSGIDPSKPGFTFGGDIFDQISDYSENVVIHGDTTLSPISSVPFVVCLCNGSAANCNTTSVHYRVYPGATVYVCVVALGQRNGAVTSIVSVQQRDLEIEELERSQVIPNYCRNISYTIYGSPGNASLELYAEGPCQTNGIGLTLEIELLDCPPGFTNQILPRNNKSACVCDDTITRYTNTCNPNDGTILRKETDTFWIGFDEESGDIITYSTCPFDHCVTNEVYYEVKESNAQCENGREGLLCGKCSEGLSLSLSLVHSRCLKCSDKYLAVLVFAVMAGVIVVTSLLLLNFTVAVGTINGVIFYTNSVSPNLPLLLSSNAGVHNDILKVIIAWFNLDYGVDSCYYDGMDAYDLAWIQFVFPLYIWALMGLIFVVCHFSTRVSRLLGRNPVPVFATIILVSYAKVVRTIVRVFSFATLEYPEGKTKVVWLYDGNVPFLDPSDGRHLILFIASLLILVILFIPYTFILLTSQWLQIKSNWKILSWLNKPQLRAFLDAYHAPFKPRHRYWPGVLLIVRFFLLTISAFTLAADPSANFLVLLISVLLLQMWSFINGGMYKNWYLNILETFFFVNLGLLAASGFYNKYESASSRVNASRSISTSILLTAAIIVFVGIVVFHILQRCKIKLPRKQRSSSNNEQEMSSMAVDVPVTIVSLREPLLDSL